MLFRSLMQDYTQDDQIRYLTSFMGGKIDYVKLELPLMDEKIALSWHLTEREKKYLTGAVYSPENRESMRRLKQLLQPQTTPSIIK